MRLINVSEGEYFIYNGNLCMIDSTVPRGGRVIAVFDVSTNEKFSLSPTINVELADGPVLTEEEQKENEEVVEAELVEEGEEDNESQSDWLEDTTEEV